MHGGVPRKTYARTERLTDSPFPLTAIVGLDLASETFYYRYADAGYRVCQMSLSDDGKIWGLCGQSSSRV